MLTNLKQAEPQPQHNNQQRARNQPQTTNNKQTTYLNHPTHTKHKFVSCHKNELHQHVLVEIGDWLILNSYIAPRPGLLELGMEKGIAFQVEAKANEGNSPGA